MKKIIGLILVAMIAAPTGFAQETLDEWTAARMDYAKSENYNPLIVVDPERKLFLNMFKTGNYQSAITLGLEWLKTAPVDIAAYHVIAVSYDKLNNKEEFENYLSKRNMLLDSIGKSGAGRTPETAFLIISTTEAHDFLRFGGMSECSFALEQIGGVERASCVNSRGEKVSFFFKYVPEYWASLPA